MKNKLFIMLVCVVVLQSCEESSPKEKEENPLRNVLDLPTLNREMAAWEKQGIANYSFVEKYNNIVLDYQAKVMVTDNAITGIEILSLDDERERLRNSLNDALRYQYFDPADIERWLALEMADYIDYVELKVNNWGSISRIYDYLSFPLSINYPNSVNWSPDLVAENLRDLRLEIRYNTEYHYPEYIYWRIVTPGMAGGGLIFELSDFKIAE